MGFADRTLIPAEAVRLAALGALADRKRPFGELAVEVRRFVARLLGPSLDALGASLEALRYEGLIEAEGPRAGPGQSLRAETVVTLTSAGQAALLELLASPIRSPFSDLGKLVVALKLRYLRLLPTGARRTQVEMLGEAIEGELARLKDFQRDDSEGPLAGWIGQDIAQAEARLAWCRQQLAELPAQ